MGAFLFVVAVVVVIMLIAAANKPKPKTRAEKFRDGLINVIQFGAQVAVLLWAEIEDWINSTRSLTGGTTAQLVRQHLNTGQVKVIGNVLKSGTVVDNKTWTAAQLDPELARRFGNRDRITV